MLRRPLVFAAAAGTLATPWAAQPPRGQASQRIGWISFADPGIRLEQFRAGLRRLGYVGARELLIDSRVVARDPQSVQATVEDMLKGQFALIVTHVNAAPAVHRAAAGRIPVVFAFSGDPVEAGLVQSLARPGGNTTGMSFLALDLVGKRMEMIKEIAPRTKRVAILANPQHPGVRAERRESLTAAQRLGLQTAYVELNPDESFDATLQAIRRRACEGLVVFPDAGMLARAQQIADFALKERMLCVSGWSEFARAGCIASYGPDLGEGYLRLAHYADRILKGDAPASLPVELPARFEMVLNLRTARALGITIPRSLRLRAEELLE